MKARDVTRGDRIILSGQQVGMVTDFHWARIGDGGSLGWSRTYVGLCKDPEVSDANLETTGHFWWYPPQQDLDVDLPNVVPGDPIPFTHAPPGVHHTPDGRALPPSVEIGEEHLSFRRIEEPRRFGRLYKFE